MSTNVSSVTKHFPAAQNGFTTTLGSTAASGATTVVLQSIGSYTNGETVVLVVDPLSATGKQVFTGVVDVAGVQITGVVWTAGTNQSHAAGVTVVDYFTATHISMMTKGLLVSHDQDGTLKAGAVDNAAALASDVVTSTKIAANAVQPDDLATNAITLGYAAVTGPQTSTSPSGTQLTGYTSSVTIPAGGRKVKITVYISNISNSLQGTYGISLWDGVVGTGSQIQAAVVSNNVGGSTSANMVVPVTLIAVVTPSAGAKTYNVGGYTTAGTVTAAASASTPGFILVEVI